VFHLWRHYYAARMEDRLESRKVMLATGHANGAVFESYADHATAEVFEEVRAAATEAFGQRATIGQVGDIRDPLQTRRRSSPPGKVRRRPAAGSRCASRPCSPPAKRFWRRSKPLTAWL